jgi:hypothetical protein
MSEFPIAYSELTSQQWHELALCFFSRDEGGQAFQGARSAVVLLGLAAPSHVQFRFIRAALEVAVKEEDYDDLGAGPVEHLLAKFGKHVVDEFCEWIASDGRVRNVMAYVSPDRVDTDTWGRIQRALGGSRP